MKLKAQIIALIVSICLAGGLAAALSFQHQKIVDLTEQLETANNNNIAYEQENAALNGKVVEFQLTANQLNASRDSIIQKLNSARKQLGIKDKQIKELQYFASENKKKDSIFVKDTVFLPGVVIDTSIVDN